jgi:outer membrane lipoprotein-sorting protein
MPVLFAVRGACPRHPRSSEGSLPLTLLRRRAFLSLVPVALGGAVLFAPGARADEVDSALAEIARARVGLQTLVGAFAQERTIGLLATAVKSEGEMTVVRPDRLRWELHPPDAITYWIGPEGLSYATPSGGASVGKSAAGRFGAVLSDLLTLIGGDLGKLRARYDLSVQKGEGGALTLSARPTAEEVKKHVKSLSLRLAPNLWAVQRIEIEEVGGDRSVITFTTMARDVKVDPARMAPPRAK